VIYLDYNATTPLDDRVLESMVPYMNHCWGNPSSPYSFGNQARIAVQKARDCVAECLGCKPAEIIFTSCGTESDNLAIRGVARTLQSRGSHIVTTAIEHHAVLNTCKALEREGFKITYLPVDSNGAVRIEDVDKSLGPETILITVMHANNETGVLQPVEEIAALAKRRGVLFHMDAVQTAGKIPRRLCELGADLISISGHKFYGPKGSAALYIREGISVDPLLTGGPHERNLRAGTENVAGIVGLSHALTLAIESSAVEYRRLQNLRDRFESRMLAALAGMKINGSPSPRVPNTSSLSFESVDGESIVFSLDLRGIYVSTGSACSTGDPEPSHVLLAMGLSPKQAQGSIRISLGKHTQDEDVDAVVSALKETVDRLRGISSITN
jgi:cysteine desulfurase